MIDFPTLFPSLVKYIPNWMEKFYPRMAQFARGEGYPCGNKGVFIPRRNKCWTHPKTGQRMRKPLTYQNYQDAKEKSQRSRTEKGRTALQDREQGFRDKAREKAKGWQNKTPESAESKQAVLDIERIKSGQHVINKRDGYSLAYRGRGVYDLNDLDVPKGWRAKPTKLTEKEATDFLADKYKSMSGIKPEPKQTPNSTGVKGAGGKSVDQQYKDIIAKSKDPKATEEAISQALSDTLDFEKKTYERYLESQKNGTVPKGYEKHYQDHIDQYKPVIEAEQFLKERRKKALDGDFETEAEVRPYLFKMMDKYKKDYDYYDSPEYAEKREKFKSIVGEAPLPPVLSGKIPAKDLRQTLKPGDKLLRKQATYGYAGSSSGNTPTGWKYSDGGEVVKAAIKNVSTKINYGMGDRMFDDSVPMRDVTHVIRDGKRYKVDDSDRSPNDLGIPESAKPKAGSAREMVGTVKVKIDPKEPAPPTPKLKSKDHAANEKYDQWLISKSQELEGKEKNYNIVTESGKKSVKGKVYENFGIHEERGRYNLTQLSSGRMLNYYDNEDLAKKSIIELNRSGIDWKLNEKELQNIPGIQTKMKSVKRKIGAVIESDKRAKELIESMMRSHEKESWDRSDDLAGYGVKVPKKQKNNFNSNLKLANFAKPGCCCDASKPLKRRKTKQTPRLKRRGNKYA